MNVLLWLGLKTAAPLALVLLVAALLRRRSAALRHSVLTAGVVAALSVPLLMPIAPAWQMPAWPFARAEAPASPAATSTSKAPSASEGDVVVHVVAPNATSPATPTGTGSTRAWWLAVVALWGAGVAMTLVMLSVAFSRLWRAHRQSDDVADARWYALAKECADRYGIVTPVALRESRGESLLITFGWRRPIVLLPPGASSWPEERRRIVLAHELAHIQRGDWMTQLAAEAMRAMLWFNPLAWVASARLRDESEQACDDLVLASDIDPADYAETLAAIARTLHTERPQWVPAPAMARPASLERRVSAMLDPSIDRSRPKRAPRLILATLLSGLAVALAGYGAAAQSFSTVRGQVQDQHGGTIGGVTVSLTSASGGQKYEVKSDVTGRYELVGVVAGEYQVVFSLPGFRTLRQPLTVAARTVTQNANMLVGSLEETITVVGPGPGTSALAMADKVAALAKSEIEPEMTLEACTPTAGGGKLKQPTKVRDARPIYPNGIDKGEIIEYDATIGTDGAVVDAKLATPGATPELVSAGESAIRQWRYTPTLLNCAPVEVEMRVHVSFRPQ